MTARKVEWGAEAAEDALAAIATRDLSTVELMFGDAMLAVSGSLRGLFVAAEGHDLICADYSAIEAVGLAELSGEAWRKQVFRTHGKIYEASAAQMFKVPLEEILAYPKEHGTHHPLRKKGKVSELAFGYQGWVGSARAFGMPGSDEEITADILAWRAASPSVEFLWGGQALDLSTMAWHEAAKAAGGAACEGEAFKQARAVAANTKPWKRSPYRFGCEGMLLNAIQNPNKIFPVYRLDGTATGMAYERIGDVVYMIMQDDSTIAYHAPRVQPSKDEWRGLSISYEGWNTNPKNGPPNQWIRMGTWGGRQVENWDQGICNRILRHSQKNLERAGYCVVQHVYDENASEIPKSFGSIDEFCDIMDDLPPFAKDWPVKVDRKSAWRGYRYRK